MQHRIKMGKTTHQKHEGLCCIHLQEWAGSAWFGHILRQGWRKRRMGPDSLWKMLSTADPQRCFSPFEDSCLHCCSVPWILNTWFYWMSIPLQSVRLGKWQLLSFYWSRGRQTPAYGWYRRSGSLPLISPDNTAVMLTDFSGVWWA